VKELIQSPVPKSDLFTISTEVMVISGSTATTVKDHPHIFYDVEVRAIIHRRKSKSSGLVVTEVYGWRGKHGEVNAQEAKKLGELANRFGCTLVSLEKALVIMVFTRENFFLRRSHPFKAARHLIWSIFLVVS
jgi:hypothetical protein